MPKKLIIFLSIFIPIFLLYAYTSPSNVYWQDAGIYLSGIKTLGVVYPPGYPLYIVGGFLWTHLLTLIYGTTLTLAKQVHLMSGIFGAAASGVVGLTVWELLDSRLKTHDLRKNTKIINHELTFLNQTIFCLFSGYVAGFSYALWAQSINAEVYSLQGLFFALMMYFALQVLFSYKEGNQKHLNTSLNCLFISWGLSFANHPTAFLFIPGVIYLLRSIRPISRIRPLRLIGMLIFFGFIPYLFLPLRSAQNPTYLWSKIDSVQAFFKHLSGTTYLTQGNSLSLFDTSKMLSFPVLFLEQFWFIGGILALIGIYIMLFKADKILRNFCQFCLLISVTIYSVVFFYNRGTEYFFWLIPVYLFASVALGYGVEFISRKRPMRLISLILVSLVLATELLTNISFLNRRNYTLTEEFGKNVLGVLPKDAILFTIGDQSSTIPQYLQYVESYRTDVILMWDFSLVYRWQRERLAQKYANLSFPQAPDKELLSNDEAKIYINDFIKSNLDHHQIFLIAQKAIPLDEKYSLIPAGTLWKVTDTIEPINLSYWNYNFSNNNRYLRMEKSERGSALRDANGVEVGIKYTPYHDEAKEFEMQAVKNLGDLCLEKAKEGSFLQLILTDGKAEQWTGRRLATCAKDEYLKLFTLDPNFYQKETYENLSWAYQNLGMIKEANYYHTEALKRTMD